MDSSTMERQAVVEGMGEIGEDATKGRGIHQSGGNFLQGKGTGCALIKLGFLVPVDGNGYNS